MLKAHLLSFASIASAVYVIQDDYEASTFASKFDFFTDNDPTAGYVNYISQSAAESSGLYRVEGDQVYMGVDHTNVATGRGRDSIRISSKATYNYGLFILDLAHMPGGQCGTWPAFWLLGPDWPTNGEVDIIEGVNSRRTNSMALHTTSGCTVSDRGQFTGQLHYSDCNINSPIQPYNTGCSINTTDDSSYGIGFNAVGGGVYATEWTSSHFAIWYFPRASIPADITAGNPSPGNWGPALSEFSGGCDIDSKFKNQQILFDVTFCGGWGGYDWIFDTTCNNKAATCNDYVQNNPSAFVDTYWRINSLKVFQDNGTPVQPISTSTTTSTSTSISTSTSSTQSSITAMNTTTMNTSSTRTTTITSTITTTITTTQVSSSLPFVNSTTSSLSSYLPTNISTAQASPPCTTLISITVLISPVPEPPTELITLTTLEITCFPSCSPSTTSISPAVSPSSPSTPNEPTLRTPSIRTTNQQLNPSSSTQPTATNGPTQLNRRDDPKQLDPPLDPDPHTGGWGRWAGRRRANTLR